MNGQSRDLPQTKSDQRDFDQTGKMAVVGRLACGVAHDVNNVLMAVSGYSDLLRGVVESNPEAVAHIEEIHRAVERGASLTRQLLTFSRRQPFEPCVLNLNDVIRRLEKMVARLIGDDIEWATELDPGIGNVKADAGQIEQVIVNLCVNARDAMPCGGRILVRTFSAEPSDATKSASLASRTVCMSVSDTGIGIPEEIRARIFEPFFTTKDAGRGTGLGLATCREIVRRFGGDIGVESHVGEGSVFHLWLPRVEEAAQHMAEAPETVDLPRGDETIMVVEEEPALRSLIATMLHLQGYVVILASNGLQAMEKVREHGGRALDLVITDVLMQPMGGKEMANRILLERRGIGILFMSGYMGDVVSEHGVLEPGLACLQKPFSMAQLARRVREVLDRKLA